MEQPEDLGALASGPHEGLRPASMWQWPQLADLLRKGLRTVAFHQASFGTPYAKETLPPNSETFPLNSAEGSGCWAGRDPPDSADS